MNRILAGLKERLKKDRRLLFIVLTGFAGMLLLLLSGISPEKTPPAVNENYDSSLLEERISENIEELLGTLEGVGRVKAQVSIDSLAEKIVAKNTEQRKDGIKDEYVLTGDRGKTDGLTLKVIMPVVRGVAVSCEGGSSPQVRNEVTRLLSACYGLAPNRIWVSEMQNKRR